MLFLTVFTLALTFSCEEDPIIDEGVTINTVDDISFEDSPKPFGPGGEIDLRKSSLPYIEDPSNVVTDAGTLDIDVEPGVEKGGKPDPAKYVVMVDGIEAQTYEGKDSRRNHIVVQFQDNVHLYSVINKLNPDIGPCFENISEPDIKRTEALDMVEGKEEGTAVVGYWFTGRDSLNNNNKEIKYVLYNIYGTIDGDWRPKAGKTTTLTLTHYDMLTENRKVKNSCTEEDGVFTDPVIISVTPL